jgi:hypothetical protein
MVKIVQNCRSLNILSHQKFVKTVQQSNSKHFRMMFKKQNLCSLKFFFDPDPEMNLEQDPEPDPELSGKSEPDPEIIFSAPTHGKNR